MWNQRQRKQNSQKDSRRGAALVEFAVVVPVFALFLAAIVEFGHVYMVQTAMRGAAKKAARLGIGDGVTTADVTTEATNIVASACRTTNLIVMVKDAGLFDSSTTVPNDLTFSDLPNIELGDAETRQLFIVRLELPYDDVALFPPFWVGNVRLHCQSVMRHE